MAGKKTERKYSDTVKTDIDDVQEGQGSGNKNKRQAKKGDDLAGRLEAAESKADANYERLMRVTAEFENYKKRAEREANDFRKFANESLLKEILPVVDNLQRALAIECRKGESALDGLRQGVEMTLKGLMDSLGKFGVASVEALGKPFDPNFHQAVSQRESGKHPDNFVCEELQKGYMIHDRLLRPSMVIVSRNPDKQQKAGPDLCGAEPSEGSETEKKDNPDSGGKIRITVH